MIGDVPWKPTFSNPAPPCVPDFQFRGASYDAACFRVVPGPDHTFTRICRVALSILELPGTKWVLAVIIVVEFFMSVFFVHVCDRAVF